MAAETATAGIMEMGAVMDTDGTMVSVNTIQLNVQTVQIRVPAAIIMAAADTEKAEVMAMAMVTDGEMVMVMEMVTAEEIAGEIILIIHQITAISKTEMAGDKTALTEQSKSLVKIYFPQSEAPPGTSFFDFRNTQKVLAF